MGYIWLLEPGMLPSPSICLSTNIHGGRLIRLFFVKSVYVDLIIVQIYVDDINFRSTSPYLCKELEVFIKNRFEMISLGEMPMFLGLQVC